LFSRKNVETMQSFSCTFTQNDFIPKVNRSRLLRIFSFKLKIENLWRSFLHFYGFFPGAICLQLSWSKGQEKPPGGSNIHEEFRTSED